MWAREARTKVVATVGPACRSPEMLRQLIQAGVDVFRFNMAHGSHEEHARSIATLRRLSQEQQQVVAVLVDLAGPKVRLLPLSPGQVELAADQQVLLGGEPPERAGSDTLFLGISHPQVLALLSPGDRVLLADGTVALQVEEATPAGLRCRVIQGGVIASRQGVNFPGVRLGLPALTEKDLQDARWAAGQDVDFVGLSFVGGPEEIQQLQQLLREHGSQAAVVAKIERPEALDHLEEIVQAADAVMVARGDLGVETDVAQMALAQKRIILLCNQYQRPVIVATQMLDSMRHSPLPTRAEATDVANAILDGADACMLSGETAVGRYPLQAVEMMHRIARSTEAAFAAGITRSGSFFRRQVVHQVTAALVEAAVHIAREVQARVIVVASHSGRTAQALASYRSHVPVLGVSDQPHVLRRLCLSWGVVPVPQAPAADSRRLCQFLHQRGLAAGELSPGDRLVMLRGTRLGAVQNILVVDEIGSGQEL